MELADTVDLMLSDDYKIRFKGEYYQLLIRINKLANLISRIDTGLIDFEPTCPRQLLAKQLNSMQDYKWILEERARVEGINLAAKDLI